ncbi:hypothetical protein HUJ05_006872 [Dendroctonus ponderosae]|nr:hypothetical protein HUJ05_006872 [Dendroctonus ponderosae]KAH1006105.1 hypothetical protein HUJ05_006872 [Dendroctonus ponderosae]KAH1006106.1 hypothetical protein HUJ05_006872 [Dendroctonus ponderosae]
MNISFEGKRILVTGAASASLKTEVSSIATRVADLADWRSTQEAVKSSLPIDYLVNSAGLVDIAPMAGITEESYQRIFDVNIKGLISVTQAVVTDLVERKSAGSVVNISSQASQAGLLNHTIYAASKGARSNLDRRIFASTAFAQIDDVIDAVVFLLSDKSSMITGHCLPVDGGFLSC